MRRVVLVLTLAGCGESDSPVEGRADVEGYGRAWGMTPTACASSETGLSFSVDLFEADLEQAQARVVHDGVDGYRVGVWVPHQHVWTFVSDGICDRFDVELRRISTMSSTSEFWKLPISGHATVDCDIDSFSLHMDFEFADCRG